MSTGSWHRVNRVPYIDGLFSTSDILFLSIQKVFICLMRSLSMHIDEIMAMIENMKNKAIEFYKGRRILKSTLTLVCRKIKKIRENLEELTDDTFERKIVIEEIDRELNVLNNLIGAMSVNILGDAKTLAHELLNIEHSNRRMFY
jgi:DNA repair exonuclease SbcCD ATPase subunit